MKVKFTLYLGTILVAFSCTNPAITDKLDIVESIVQDHPDSALTIIRSIDTLSLKSRAIRARYSLLHVTALDKSFIDTTDLRVILPASEYYANHGSSADRMKAYFYHGRIYSNRKENDKAMQLYLSALSDSAHVVDNHYKELVNSAISDVFSRNHNPDQELKYLSTALRYGRLDKDLKGIWAITGHMATCFANLHRWDDAERTYHEYFEMPVYDTLSFFRRKINHAKLLLLKPLSEPGRCAALLEEIASVCPEAMTYEAYCIYAYAHQLLGNDTIADNLMSEIGLMDGNQNVIRLWRYRIEREQKEFERALIDLEQSMIVQDSIVISTLSQSLVQSQRDYADAEALSLKRKNELKNQQFTTTAILFLIVLAFFFYLFSRSNKILNKRIEDLSSLQEESMRMLNLQADLNVGFGAQLAQKDADLLALRRQFASMYRTHYKTLNDLCAAYLSPIKKDRRDLIYDMVMNQIGLIVNDDYSQNKFMSLVNESLGGIIDKLRVDLPDHKDSDFRFLMFVIIGFDAKTISSITGYSVGTVYVKKNRLKNEISMLSSPYKDYYLEYIT